MKKTDPDITPRLQQILLVMLRTDRVYSVKELADQIGMSKRTVQRELGYMESTLKKYGLSFRSKTGSGVWIDGEEEAKTNLFLMLSESDVIDTSDRVQRRKRLILEILKDRDLKKLYYYSNLLGVSEATISSDLEAIEGWFLPFGLKIVRRQGYGVTIEGSEKDYRWAMRAFIEENIDTKLLQEFYENRNLSAMQLFGDKNEKNIYTILDDEVLKRVITCLLSLNDRRILNLTENSYVGLVLHITIAINRIMKQEIIENNEYLMQTLNRDDDYEFAVFITRMLEKEFDIVIPEIESAYICLHIQGAKRQYSIREEIPSATDEKEELTDVVYEMIDAYDPEISYILKQDEEFIGALMAHLQPTFVRLKNKMKITNPLLDQIKSDYAEIFNKCGQVAGRLGERLGCSVPEAETGFLAIHFGAAVVRIEQQRENRRKVEIGIVCASGIGISRLMATKVKKHFRSRAEIHTYGKADLSPYVLDSIDFFISTVTVEEEEADILRVSPLLTEQDLDDMERRIQKYEKLPEHRKADDSFSAQLDEINYMAERIKSLIREFEVVKVSSMITFEQIVKEISMNMSSGRIEAQMIEEALIRREQSGTQIFPQFGFALLHSKTDGVDRPAFSVWLPQDAVQFKDPAFRGIGAVIIMLFPEQKNVRENSSILGYLSEVLIEESEFLDTIIGGDKEEIREILTKLLKKFFSDYLNQL